MSDRTRRLAAILRIVQQREIRSQNQLREFLAEKGLEVGQATLSRDIRELGIIRSAGVDGAPVYAVPPDISDPAPAFQRLMPALFLSAEGVDHFLVVRTLTGGAQPLAVAIDREEWDEVLGTIAGDDTILIILRSSDHRDTVRHRLEDAARDD
ncbi:MAG: arginine repressor [Candidatus Longimicrobiales bacterium M2_2A_002]